MISVSLISITFFEEASFYSKLIERLYRELIWMLTNNFFAAIEMPMWFVLFFN